MKQKGFTLVELLIVISIMGMLLIMVFVNFGTGKQSNDLRQTSIVIQQAIRSAQNYSIGGNSVKYCTGDSGEYLYEGCVVDGDCGASGVCSLSVPLGGYGFHISDPDNYRIYGDKNGNRYYDDATLDYVVSYVNLSFKGIHISEVQFDDAEPIVPSIDNQIDVTFEPIYNDIYIYRNSEEAEIGGELVERLTLLVKSDYLDNTCRKIVINKVSGLVDEIQSPCSL